MKSKLILNAAILLMTVSVVQAQDMSATQNNNPFDRSSWFNSDLNSLYRPYELSLDAFGSVASDGHGDDHYYGDYHRHDARAGGGGGLEYFFSRYIGIEAETFANANNHDTTSAVGGNLVLRLPIGQTGFSPYIFGGGGHDWTYRSEGYGDGGVGLEYRFTRSVGIFADGRFMDPASTHNYGMGRFGVRFIF